VSKKAVCMLDQFVLVLSICMLACSRAAATEVKIQVKSFIRHMAGPGEPSNGPPSESTKKALGFEGLSQTRTDAYLFMLATDKMFSENPPDGGKGSAQFRLWSQLVGDVTCQRNKVSAAVFKPVEAAFGNEGPLDSVGDISRNLSTTVSYDTATFNYRVRGRPHNSSIAAFTSVRPRSCTYIWHDVSGVVSCSSGAPAVKVTLKASAFPTRKIWVNGKQLFEKAQGPFENLWMCDPADNMQVN
jgi:hypothetical protein